MNRIEQRIAGLSPDKRALLEKWLLDNGTTATHTQIPPRLSSDPCALSFAQQRLWFLNQLEPESPIYNVPHAIRIRGALNSTALQQALNAIVNRHHALRSTFDVAAGSPVQVVRNVPVLELPALDLRGIAEAEREVEIQRLLEEEGRRPFNLSKDLMIRTLLLRVRGEEHVLLMTMHHIASDAWSTGILFREIASLYEDFSGGKPARLPELPIQYADYAVWQRARFQGELLASQLAYWRNQLDHLSPVLELPTDRPRPSIQTHRGARHAFKLPRNLTDGLRALSRQEGVTLYMTLLAAFQTLLHRYTGKDDIVVGSPIAGRDRMETEGLIGFFVNTLVLRTGLSGDPGFRELLARVREVALEAFAHQELPFEKLVEELRPERNLSHNPLFQVVFVMQNTPRQELELEGLRLTPQEVDSKTAKFDLTLAIRDSPNRDQELSGSLEYNTDLFDSATALRMLGHFQTLLEGILADPDQPLSALPLMTDAERTQVAKESDGPETDDAGDRCIHQLFESQAERTPENIALIFGAETLTYHELNRRANQLAHLLKRMGVGPDVLVGLFLERSLDMVVALLGVLKAGGAYVPMDTAYPTERLAFMIADATPVVLITQKSLQENIPEHKASIVCLDSGELSLTESSDNPDSRISTGSLAYVIYTSGSTGNPKGVQISHRALTNVLTSMQHTAGLTAVDSILAITTMSFDIAALELLLPLCAGGRVILVSRQAAADASQLRSILQLHHVTVMQATPITWQLLIEAGWTGQRDLKILCGGEALSPALAEKLLEMGSCVWNCYGPTETTIYSLIHRVSAINDGVVPIGHPIGNTQVYVLDPHQQPVPIGVPGELYIGGAGLARGYLNRPDLTAGKFLRNPFSRQPDSRLYRTGDLARYRPDGTVEFLGRMDDQVKLRGYRIELGEIESVLDRHPAVRQTIVALREDSPGDQRLIAYVVCQEGQSCSIDVLRSFLGKKLPDYMIPSGFVFLETLPLTSNGKIDRKLLPPPKRHSIHLETAYVPPRTPVEQVVARIWGEVLKLEQVSVVDNFFRLGGHSLLATQVASRIRSTLRFDLPVRKVFEAPTVQRLCEVMLTEEQPAGRLERIARIVMEVAAMSAEEADRALESKKEPEQSL